MVQFQQFILQNIVIIACVSGMIMFLIFVLFMLLKARQMDNIFHVLENETCQANVKLQKIKWIHNHPTKNFFLGLPWKIAQMPRPTQVPEYEDGF